MVNKDNKPLVMKRQNQNAIYCHLSYGPTFGNGYDFYIADNSNVVNTSYSNLGSTYKHPEYAYGTNEAKCFLAGSYNFQTVEIEVYTKQV